MTDIYLLWIDDFVCEDRSLVGIYSTEEKAKKAIEGYRKAYTIEVERGEIYRLTEKKKPKNYFGYLQIQKRQIL